MRDDAPMAKKNAVAAAQRVEVERYFATGHIDDAAAVWEGHSFVERSKHAQTVCRQALATRLKRVPATPPAAAMPRDLEAFTRARVAPMVEGLFPAAEVGTVLDVLARSVVVVDESTIERLVLEADFEHSAWTLANLYLGSVGAPLLSDEAPRIVGLSEHMTCFVTPEYFAEKNPFADFVVHEAAHVFHNCKRRTIGLPETRTKEWLLPVAFGKRETFAYSCETFSRLVALGADRQGRLALAREFAGEEHGPSDDVDFEEVEDIVLEAAGARNGWKRILARCAAPKRKTWAQVRREAEAAALGR